MITFQKTLLRVPELFTTEQVDITPFSLATPTAETFSYTIPDDKYIRVIRIFNGVYIANTTIFTSAGRIGRTSSTNQVPEPFWLGPGQSIVCTITVSLTGTTRRTSYVFATRRADSTTNEIIWESNSQTITANTFDTGSFFTIMHERYAIPENNLPDELVAP